MRKLTLDVDDLRVDSFRILPADGADGTVRGNSACQYSDAGCTQFWSTCPTAPETEFACSPGSGAPSCGTCSAEEETCAWPCRVSDATDCHRC